MWEIKSNDFFKELNLFMLSSLITGSIATLLIFQDLKLFLAFLIGGALAYLNFTTLKKEGIELLQRVRLNVTQNLANPYQRERTFFILKTYLRLLALGILFYFLIKFLRLQPVFLILGFSLVYFQIFLVILRFWLKKRETLLGGG